jgi:hypothetical protein
MIDQAELLLLPRFPEPFDIEHRAIYSGRQFCGLWQGRLHEEAADGGEFSTPPLANTPQR